MKKPVAAILTVWMTVFGILPVEAATPAFHVSEKASENMSAVDALENTKDYDYWAKRFPGDKRITLEDLSYSFWEELTIPGLPDTRDSDFQDRRTSSISLYPQGMCTAGEYLLITAYSDEEGAPGCLYLFDRETGAYLSTLGLKDTSHLGGIAFDGENVWICHSDDNTLQRIPYLYIHAVGKNASGQLIDISDSIEAYPVQNTPSCITCYNGHILVATTSLLLRTQMVSYRFDESALIAENTYSIPTKVQGVAVNEDGTVFFSISYGRRNSSQLNIYASLAELHNPAANPFMTVELPPCSEEIVIDDNHLLVLFESAGYKYYEGNDGLGRTTAPIDKVLSIDLDCID